jgi:uncharacterized protein (DUF2141 family)
MPIFHPVATSATRTGNDITVLCSLPDNRNGGEIQVRLVGDAGAWTSPDANGAYSSSSITDTFLALPAGSYDVRVLTGDGEYSNTLAGAVVVASGGGHQIGVGLAISPCFA